jgi:hypothetical protein
MRLKCNQHCGERESTCLGKKGNSYGKEESFLDNQFLGQHGREEHGNLKETLVDMVVLVFGAIECMKKHVVSHVE